MLLGGAWRATGQGMGDLLTGHGRAWGGMGNLLSIEGTTEIRVVAIENDVSPLSPAATTMEMHTCSKDNPHVATMLLHICSPHMQSTHVVYTCSPHMPVCMV